ncbi:hypothetical protein SB761_29720, partial [Pseudomonas sp. SIMBA_064]
CRRESQTLAAWADRNGNTVPGQMFAIAYACIAAFRRGINKAIVHHNLHPQQRMAIEKLLKQGRKNIDHHRTRHVQPE